MIIAHQFPQDIADRIAEKATAADIELVSLWDAPWIIPEEATVLLVNTSHPDRVRKSSPKPAGWPGKLRWVHLRSTGLDGLPDWIFEVELVTNSRGAQAVAIAEYVLASMLAHEKALPDLWVKNRDEWTRRNLGSLPGKILGIIGYGHIGMEVAKRAVAFDMDVLALRRTAGPTGLDGVAPASLDQILRGSDHILISAPLTSETQNLIDAAAFAKMKPGMHLINVGRGAIVDTDALRRALDAGIVAGASLDVIHPEPPPEGHWAYSHPGVRLTAHISSNASVTQDREIQILLDNIAAYHCGAIGRMHGLLVVGKGY